MCTANHQTRGRSRRVRPGRDRSMRPSFPPKHELAHTASTAASTSLDASDKSDDSSRPINLDEFRQRICPVTGVPRDIHGDYHLSSTVLGRGHYGIVRECIHRRTHKTYACKSVEKSKIKRLDHLQREIYLLHKLRHDNVMKMVDCYEDAEYVHIVTKKYTGGELFDQIADHTTPEGCFSEEKTARIIKSLLEAVAYLHAKDVVHRDIKPENILFENSQEDADVKLIDFGLSRRHRPNEEPMNNPVGTAYYMAPELLAGSYDKACDVFSVGTIVFIMLCGYPPFNGETDADIFESIKRGKLNFPKMAWSDKSEGAKAFIRCLLAMDPKKRPSAEEALNHPWLKLMCNEKEERQEAEMSTRIQSLRNTISRFRLSMRQECH